MIKLIVLIVACWLPSLYFSWNTNADFFFWRHQLTLLSGAIALIFMAIGMVLAARFRPVENWIHGLDKGYALHKKLGIGALVALIIHWLIIKAPKWLIQLELIARPHRQQRLGGIGFVA